ncbi:MAG: hypothetical protein AAF679_03720 [Pseudomonadota bacterium]
MGNQALPCTVTVKEGALRSLSANALLHRWYADVARHLGDMTAGAVKGVCHHKYGLPIRLQDDQFQWVWSRSGALLSYEKQCAALGSGTFGISSKMTTKELKSYMDEMQRDYAEQGVRLTDPEARK